MRVGVVGWVYVYVDVRTYMHTHADMHSQPRPGQTTHPYTQPYTNTPKTTQTPTHAYAPVIERRGAEEAVAVVGDEEAAVDVDLLRHELRPGPEGGAAVHAGVRPEAWWVD